MSDRRKFVYLLCFNYVEARRHLVDLEAHGAVADDEEVVIMPSTGSCGLKGRHGEGGDRLVICNRFFDGPHAASIRDTLSAVFRKPFAEIPQRYID